MGKRRALTGLLATRMALWDTFPWAKGKRNLNGALARLGVQRR
jgi:hypothetical protein